MKLHGIFLPNLHNCGNVGWSWNLVSGWQAIHSDFKSIMFVNNDDTFWHEFVMKNSHRDWNSLWALTIIPQCWICLQNYNDEFSLHRAPSRGQVIALSQRVNASSLRFPRDVRWEICQFQSALMKQDRSFYWNIFSCCRDLKLRKLHLWISTADILKTTQWCFSFFRVLILFFDFYTRLRFPCV